MFSKVGRIITLSGGMLLKMTFQEVRLILFGLILKFIFRTLKVCCSQSTVYCIVVIKTLKNKYSIIKKELKVAAVLGRQPQFTLWGRCSRMLLSFAIVYCSFDFGNIFVLSRHFWVLIRKPYERISRCCQMLFVVVPSRQLLTI